MHNTFIEPKRATMYMALLYGYQLMGTEQKSIEPLKRRCCCRQRAHKDGRCKSDDDAVKFASQRAEQKAHTRSTDGKC